MNLRQRTLSLDAEKATLPLAARCNRGGVPPGQSWVQRYQRLVHTIVRRIGLDDHAAADVFRPCSAACSPPAATQSGRRLQAWIVTLPSAAPAGSRFAQSSLLSQPTTTYVASAAAADCRRRLATTRRAAGHPGKARTVCATRWNVYGRALPHAADAALTTISDDAVAYDEVARWLDMPLGKASAPPVAMSGQAAARPLEA